MLIDATIYDIQIKNDFFILETSSQREKLMLLSAVEESS